MSTTHATPLGAPGAQLGPGGAAGTGAIEVTAGLPADWDALAGSGPTWATRRWLTLAPAALPGRPVGIVLRRAGRAVLAVSGTVLTEPSPDTRLDPYAIFSGGAAGRGLATGGPHPWRSVPAADVLPCLLLMLPHCQTVPVGPAAADPVACAELVGAVLDWAARHGIRSVAAQYLDPAAGALADALVAAGGTAVTLTDRCDLAVTWRDFDGYLDRLPNRRRVAVRRELQALADGAVRLTWETLPTDTAELVGLRCALVAKHRGTADPAREKAALARIRAVFGPSVTLFAARRDGRRLGFALFVQDGPTWTPLMCGADRASPAGRLSYFATLFYEPAAMAPRLGVGTIPYGQGSREAKRRRGCRLVPLTGVCLQVPGSAR